MRVRTCALNPKAYTKDKINTQLDHSDSGGSAPLNPCSQPAVGHIWIQIWQYIPIYPAIIPIYTLLSDTLGFLDHRGAPLGPPMRTKIPGRGMHTLSEVEGTCISIRQE